MKAGLGVVVALLLGGSMAAAQERREAPSGSDQQPQAPSGGDQEPQAPPATFSGSTTAIGEWRTDNHDGLNNNDDFGDLVIRHDLLLDGGDTRASLRIDQEGFARAPAGVDRRNESRIERVALEATRSYRLGGGPLVEARGIVGDFYVQLGRGLALSLRRVDEVGIDVALRGGRVDLGVLGDRLGLTLLGGFTNVVNIEPTRLAHVDDPLDRIIGARLEGRPGRAVTLGTHVASVQSPDTRPGAASPDGTVNYGQSLDVAVGPAAIGLEVDGQRRRVFDTYDRGTALYAMATAPAGPATLLAEFKHYDDFRRIQGEDRATGEAFYYSLPPTAERVDQEVLDNTDVTGGRLQADLKLDEEGSTAVYASGGIFRDRFFREWFSHDFGGIRQRWASGAAFSASAGWRREWRFSASDLTRSIMQADFDGVLPLGSHLGLHGNARADAVQEVLGRTFSYNRGNSLLEIDFYGKAALGGGFEWDTQTIIPDVAHYFGFGVAKWRPSDAFVVQALGGSQRGGIRCVLGVCRWLPPFAGGRLDVTVRY